MSKPAGFSGFLISLVLSLTAVTNVMADAATSSGGIGGGTGSALPNAGTSSLTYLIFAGGALLFIWGMLKLALSYRD